VGEPFATEWGQAWVGLVQEALAPTGAAEVHMHVVQGKEHPFWMGSIWYCRAAAQEEAGRVDGADRGALWGGGTVRAKDAGQ
jgi:hypothetical protein